MSSVLYTSPDFTCGARCMQDAILLELNTLDTEGLSANDTRRAVYKLISGMSAYDAVLCAFGSIEEDD